jgi:hypothetical protein
MKYLFCFADCFKNHNGPGIFLYGCQKGRAVLMTGDECKAVTTVKKLPCGQF